MINDKLNIIIIFIYKKKVSPKIQPSILCFVDTHYWSKFYEYSCHRYNKQRRKIYDK